MAGISRNIIVLDFETVGLDPYSTDPCQIGAVAIDQKNATIIPNSEFMSYMRPDESLINKDTLKWHANLKGVSEDAILKTWREAPSQESVMLNFANYANQYNTKPAKPTPYTAAMMAGYNINNFDSPIINRLAIKHKLTDKENKPKFLSIQRLDLIDLCFWWFESSVDLPNYKLDTLRDYLGISKENAHDALQDVRDTAIIICKFLKLHRNLLPKVKFRGSCG